MNFGMKWVPGLKSLALSTVGLRDNFAGIDDHSAPLGVEKNGKHLLFHYIRSSTVSLFNIDFD